MIDGYRDSDYVSIIKKSARARLHTGGKTASLQTSAVSAPCRHRILPSEGLFNTGRRSGTFRPRPVKRSAAHALVHKDDVYAVPPARQPQGRDAYALQYRQQQQMSATGWISTRTASSTCPCSTASAGPFNDGLHDAQPRCIRCRIFRRSRAGLYQANISPRQRVPTMFIEYLSEGNEEFLYTPQKSVMSSHQRPVRGLRQRSWPVSS